VFKEAMVISFSVTGARIVEKKFGANLMVVPEKEATGLSLVRWATRIDMSVGVRARVGDSMAERVCSNVSSE